MIRRFLITAPAIVLAIAVLLFSVHKTAAVEYAFTNEKIHLGDLEDEFGLKVAEGFYLPAQKVADRVELVTALSDYKKSQVLLNHSNKRLVLASKLLEKGNLSQGVSELSKAEMYLFESYEVARDSKSSDARDFLKEITLTSLKHREVLENLLVQSPDEVRPHVTKAMDFSKLIYSQAKVVLDISS